MVKKTATVKTVKAGASPATAATSPRHRSGAVARMLHMPVATLRVWERRYALTRPALSPSGQRLYSADDVRRLAMLKQLTDLGHAIGSVAALDEAQLQAVASTHADALVTARRGTRAGTARQAAGSAWRIALVGAMLGPRLQRPALLKRLGRPVEVLGPFASVAQAAAALQGLAVDVLLIHETLLHPDWLEGLVKAAPALAAAPKAVLYGYASEAVCDTLASAGVSLLREPQSDTVLGQWLHSVAAAAGRPWQAPSPPPAGEPVPPPRWDDAALADFAGLSSTIACECPRHVAELLMQLSHFEAYSAACANRHLADAQLHAYLQQVAASARASFETALEHIAVHEGLMPPVAAAR
ncbi:MAG: MerR family transcriptional regulator [Burkholderiaceae bacterium]|nr:MerR family transcriptional regulator [Burkholderiaceae bacterium]